MQLTDWPIRYVLQSLFWSEKKIHLSLIIPFSTTKLSLINFITVTVACIIWLNHRSVYIHIFVCLCVLTSISIFYLFIVPNSFEFSKPQNSHYTNGAAVFASSPLLDLSHDSWNEYRDHNCRKENLQWVNNNWSTCVTYYNPVWTVHQFLKPLFAWYFCLDCIRKKSYFKKKWVFLHLITLVIYSWTCYIV